LIPSAVARPGPEIRLSRAPTIESVMQVNDFGLREKIGKVFTDELNQPAYAIFAISPNR
jgi:hypothetical protein